MLRSSSEKAKLATVIGLTRPIESASCIIWRLLSASRFCLKVDYQVSSKSSLENFSIVEIRQFVQLLEHMSATSSNIGNACEQCKRDNQSLESLEKLFKSFREIVGAELGIKAFKARSGMGRHVFLTQDTEEKRKLDDFVEQLKEIVAAAERVANMKPKIEAPEVRIGSLSTVIFYLLPALLWRLRDLCYHTKRILPHVTMCQGESGQQFRLLLEGKLDFVIQRDNVKAPRGVEKFFALDYWTKEQGLVFRRYSVSNSSKECFPKLMRAVETGRFPELVDALEEYPLILIHKDLDDQFDSTFAEDLQRLFYRPTSRKKNSSGQRIFVPTTRHERQLMHLGLGVSVGHVPSKLKETRWSIKEVPVFLGQDREYANSLLYIPMRVFNSSQKVFDGAPRQFTIFKRSRDAFTPHVESVVEALKLVISQPDPELEYLEFEVKDGKFVLLHTFDFSGHIDFGQGVSW